MSTVTEIYTHIENGLMYFSVRVLKNARVTKLLFLLILLTMSVTVRVQLILRTLLLLLIVKNGIMPNQR